MEVTNSKKQTSRESIENCVFGVVLLGWQIGVCFVYGYRLKYTEEPTLQYDHFLVAMLSLLVLGMCVNNEGFGLMSVYIKKASAASLVHMFLILAVTFQLYFIAVGLYERAGVPYQDGKILSSGKRFIPISLTNIHNDRSNSNQIYEGSYVDCLACCISLLVAYGAVAGRISNLQTLLFASVGIFAY